MLRLAADGNVDGHAVRGRLRRQPDLDLVRVQDTKLLGADDPAVLKRDPMRPEIYDLQIDDANATEMARHHVRAGEAFQVLAGQPVYLPNKRERAAALVMIGRTVGGRWLTIPLAPTGTHGIWRPVTAWDSSAAELARYRSARRR